MSDDRNDPLADWFGDGAAGTGRAPDAQPFEGPDGDAPPTKHPSRRPVVVIGLAAAVLWTTAAVLGASGAPQNQESPAAGGTPPVVPGPSPEPGASPDPGLSPEPAPSPGPGASRTPGNPPQGPATDADETTDDADPAPVAGNKVGGRAAAQAVIALHDLVSTAAGDGAARWIDAAAVESVEALDVAGPPNDVDAGTTGQLDVDAGTVTVVTLQAVVLDGDDDGWSGRRRARFAIPISCAGGRCQELAAPWPLANDDADRDPGPAAAGDDAGAAAADANGPLLRALTAVGYRDVTVTGSGTLWPGVVEVQAEAVAPGEARPAAHVVWVLADSPAAEPEVAPEPSARVLGGGRPD